MAVDIPAARMSNIDGLEVTQGLTWASWRPGGEYTKKVVVKNVAFDKRKIDFSVPHSQVFGTLVYPKAITLNPGTTYSMPVVFKPLESKQYEDKIEFKTKNKKISIPIKAVLPDPDVQIPDQLNFSYCAVKDSVTIKFTLKNLSSYVLPFKWKIPSAFSIAPKEGTLKGNGVCPVEIKFTPEAAGVYDGQAVLVFGEDKWKQLRLEGIGKYPHVTLGTELGAKTSGFMMPDEIVDFGEVNCGSMSTRSLDIHNYLNVNALFNVSQLNSGRDIDKFFYCTTSSGAIPAHGKVSIKFSYQPAVCGHQHVEYFAVTPVGHLSRTIVKCTGVGRGPSVQINSNHLDFGIIERLGASKTLSVVLSNDSPMPAHFQFNSPSFDSDSVFKVSPRNGVIIKGHPVTVGITFVPTNSIGYYKRLEVLVNQQDSLFVDVFGVAHCEEFKPKAITYTQVTKHYKQLQNGLGKLSPEHLDQLLVTKKISAASGALDWVNDVDKLDQSEVRDLSDPQTAFEKYFERDVPDHEKFVTLEKTTFDFGRVTTFNDALQQTLNVTNNTKAKLTIAWTASGASSASCFWVEPQICDIPPLKAQSFRVCFKPDGFDKFFGTQIEAFAFFKVMRDHELVKDNRCVTLPRCVMIETVGHTFTSVKDTFKADLEISNRKITMPPCVSSVPSYQTLYLLNKGDTSLTYNFDRDSKGHFEVWPQCGLILPGSVQICVARFVAEEIQKYSTTIQCHVNHNAKYLKTFVFSAFVDSPQLLMDSNAMVFMKPTTPGDTVKKNYAFRNNSRLSLNFEWRISKEDHDFISISPSSGVLAPNEIQSHEVTLKTQSKKVSHYKPFLKVVSKMSSLHKSYKVQVICETMQGSLESLEEVVDFGEVVCGNRQTKSFTVYNSSNVDITFKLVYAQQVQGPYSDEEVFLDKPALQLSPLIGNLPARTHKLIQVTVNPTRRIDYKFDVQGLVVQSANDDEGMKPISLCSIIVRGMFPCLQIKDAQCFGSAENMSKVYLWRLLNVDRLNQVLDADPEESELRYSAISRMSMESRRGVVPGQGRNGSFDLSSVGNPGSSAIDMNFGSAPAGSANTKIVLLFENTSHVETEWSFYFPNDLKLELEYWAQSGDFTEEELHQLMVSENKLFKIHPQSGKLQPGQSIGITLTYQHLFPGTNRIPVLLKLNRGREIVLNFVGVTVEPERRYLHFASPVHQFRPVPIAGTEPPQQLYEFYNGGSLPLKCSLDLTALDNCKAENFNCAIFECLDKELYIEPGKSCALRWIFRPIEAKLYTVEVPVIIEHGETAVIFFEGMGYDNRDVGEKGVENGEDTLDTIPSRQIVPKPRQQVFLSEERVSFGDLPLFTRGRRVVCLTNTSYSDTVKFEWQPNQDPFSKCVTLWPMNGTLGPQESAMFNVTFTSTGFPSFYNLDFTCQIVNSSQMARYEWDVAQWEKMRAQQDQEFTITERNAHEAHKAGGSDSALKSVRLKHTTPPLTPSDIDFKHYETLPPIKKTRGDKDHRKCHRKSRNVLTEDGSHIWERPLPPKPFVLHLGVTARTHNVQEFEESFGDVGAFFVDRTLSKDFETDIEKLQKNPDRIVALCSEYDVATGIFTSLVKSMFDDSTFHQAIKNVQSEPIPYFAQLKPYQTPPGDSEQTSAEKSPVKLDTPPCSPTGVVDKGSKTRQDDTRVKIDVHGVSDVPATSGSGKSSGGILKKQTSNLAQELSGILNTEDTFFSDVGDETEPNKLLHSIRAGGKGSQISFSNLEPGMATEKTTTPTVHMPATPELHVMERNNKLMEALRSDAEVAFCSEKSLENCLSNIISEAVSQTFNPVVKPRLIAESLRRATSS